MTPQTQHDRAIAELALRQHGNVTRSQLLAIGLTADMIKHRVHIGRLYPVHRGVYAVGRSPNMPIEHAAAAVLACGPWAALCCGSALALWGIDKYWDRPFEVVVPSVRVRPGIRCHRLSTLHHRDLTTQLGIRTTTLARTLLDVSPSLTERRRKRTVNDALYSPFMTDSHLAEVLARNPNHRGTPLLTPFAAETRTGITRSDLEDMFKKLCKDYGLPTPLTNVRVVGYKADAYFPKHGLIVELDSWEFHRSRISFEENRDRDADMLAAGLVTTRLTDERMKNNPAKEAARLQQILNWLERGRPGPQAAPPASYP